MVVVVLNELKIKTSLISIVGIGRPGGPIMRQHKRTAYCKAERP